VIVVRELPAPRDHLLRGRRELEQRLALARRPLRTVDSRKAVLARELLDEHVPVRQLHHLDDEVVREDRPPGQVDPQLFRREKRSVGRLQALDHQVVDLERAAAEMDAEIAHVHGPIEVVRSRRFRALLQRRTEIDRERRDNGSGDQRDEHREEAQERARPPLRRRRHHGIRGGRRGGVRRIDPLVSQ
jgi:hypothetical protein